MKQILLCTDLDRTLLPNGIQPESPLARPLFKKLVAKPFVTLAYVSGRDFKLLQQAIKDYNLPPPDFMIGDVGTTIYHKPDGQWQQWREWQDIIGQDWQGTTVTELAAHLSDLKELDLQEPEKQSRFKLSYYTDPNADFASLQKKVLAHLGHCQAKVKLVASVDEVNQVGLFDVLPETASKLQAVNFFIEKTGILLDRTIYTGDSGNDLEVLTSRIKAVLVANATSEVRQQAAAEAPADSLYLARGNFMQMNGNYAAGLLEGIAHYLPELVSVIADEQ
ncbi:MAG: HAD-IIB family hydrolase [Desulfobulbaceae bacterium]|nr:HAD-IIB family hydrolase [Desulfobulbaceae bacterium]